MNQSLEEEVKRLAQQVTRDPAQPVLPDGIKDAEIDAFEDRTGLTVPSELREWLKFTNGPRISYGGVSGIRTDGCTEDIEAAWEVYSDHRWRERGWIPIAGDGCGNWYVIATQQKDGPGNPVFFIDNALDPTKPSYVAASDLWHFLRFYFRHDLGERDWPFDKEKVLAEDPALRDYTTWPRGWEADD